MEDVIIETGLGKIIISIEGNLKLKMFIDSLKDKIEMDGKLDAIIDFLDDGAGEYKELQEKIGDLESQVSEKDKEIEELEENQVDEDTIEADSEIDTGIGFIEYKEPDNILLQQIMENLEDAIRRTTPLRVSQALENVA